MSSTTLVDSTHSAALSQSPECSPLAEQLSPGQSQAVALHSSSRVQFPLLHCPDSVQCRPSAIFSSSCGSTEHPRHTADSNNAHTGHAWRRMIDNYTHALPPREAN